MSEETISIADAKKHFSELVGQVAYGKKKLLITKRGMPMARLVPVEGATGHLADINGWLDEDDPFFNMVDSIVAARQNHLPRALSTTDES